jgi:hypothetical protein
LHAICLHTIHMTIFRFLLSLLATAFLGMALTLAAVAPHAGTGAGAAIVGALLSGFAAALVTRAMVRLIREGRA